MKRLFILFLIALFSTHSFHYDSGLDTVKVFSFPDSLLVIEEEAFTGTAANIIILPEGFQLICENAFSNVSALKDIYIPDSTTFIADNALPLNSALTIHGVGGSFAEQWADQHEVAFNRTNIKTSLAGDEKDADHGKAENVFHVFASESPGSGTRHPQAEFRSRRPQDRHELNPIDYKFP